MGLFLKPSCVALAALLALLPLAGCGEKPQLPTSAQQPAQIAFATDLHYISQRLTDNGPDFVERMEYGDGKVVHYCEGITEAFVAQVMEQQPDALVLGGDLTFNGAKESHEDLAKKLKRVQESGVPVLVLPGNHDIDGYKAGSYIDGDFIKGQGVDEKGFYKIYKDFGYRDAVSRDKTSLSYFYPLRSDLWVLLLDVNAGEKMNVVSEATLQWLEEQLAYAKENGIAVLSASHQNLLAHNELFTGGYIIENSDVLVSLFDRYGVVCNLSGHIHIQSVTQRQQGVSEVVTTAMAVTPNQYGVVTYDGREMAYSTQRTDVDAWAAATGQTDPNLKSFAAYSRDFFWTIAHRQVMDVQVEDGVPEADARELARYFADVNTAYFQGAPITRMQDDPAYALWQRYCKGERTLVYIDTMLERGAEGQTAAGFPRY